jgi:mannose-6-phosphate isomerase
VIKIALEGEGKTSQRAIDGPSVCVVTKGEGKVAWTGGEGGDEGVKKGDVVFVGAGEEVGWEGTGGLEVFRAFVEVQ